MSKNNKPKNKEKKALETDKENNEINKNSDIIVDDEIVELYIDNAKNEDISQDNNESDTNNKIIVSEDRTIDIKKKRKLNKKIVIICSVILAIIISIVVIAVINKMETGVYSNVYLDNKNISGMSSAELTAYLQKIESEKREEMLSITQNGNTILDIVPEDIDFEIDIAKVEKEILSFGRDSNIVKNNIDIIFALFNKKVFKMEYKYDISKLTDITKEVNASLDGKVVDDSYAVDTDKNKLLITRGKTGNAVDENQFKREIIKTLADRTIKKYEVKVIKTKPNKVDVDVIFTEVSKDPKDAYIDKSTAITKFVPHELGITFDKDELRKTLESEENLAEGKVIEYGLTITEPKVKNSDIKWDFYEHQVSTYTTYFPTSDVNRSNNLKVALNYLNGTIIMPGETFSYNATVGNATAARGFKNAATFVGGRVVSEVGGGICQTVSTLYNTALLANMEIVQRKPHSLPVGYVPPSRDATVYYPSIDFKFKNNREFPVKLVTTYNANGSLTIALYGTKQDNEYKVTITSKTLSTNYYTTNYVHDSSMAEGTQIVTQAGSNGYSSEAYITKELNGKVVYSGLLSRDTYKPVAKQVKIGTKKAPVAPPVTPPTTPEVTPPSEPTDSQTGSGQ